MLHIKLQIFNVNNGCYKKIILRKFFNMVFFSEDGKKVTIYTATVFGGMNNDQEVENGILVPTYQKRAECTLRFQYNIDDISTSVKFEDLTKSFCEQSDCIEKVWGTCQKLKNQTEVNGKLHQLYSDLKLSDINMSNESVYFISERGKSKTHEFIAVCGQYSEDQDKGSHSYTLRSSTEPHDGLEYLNWVKSEISLSKNIFNRQIVFEISLEDGNKSVYYTPDFTWYFAPPGSYHVDKETAEVDIGDVKGARNFVQSVAHDTTVYFREWENAELIDERKKVRVNLKEYTSVPEQHKLSSKGNIAVKLTITNPNHNANKQFFMGLLVAFLLAFCADKTRMNDFYECLHMNCSCDTLYYTCHCKYFCNLFSLVFPFVALLTYVSFILKLKLCVPVKRNRLYYILYVVKFMGVVSACILVIYTFVLWMVINPKLVVKFISTCSTNWSIITGLTLLSVLCNIIYVTYCTMIRKKNIFDNM